MGSRPSCLELIFIIYSYNLLVDDRCKRQQENARRLPKGDQKNAKGYPRCATKLPLCRQTTPFMKPKEWCGKEK